MLCLGVFLSVRTGMAESASVDRGPWSECGVASPIGVPSEVIRKMQCPVAAAWVIIYSCGSQRQRQCLRGWPSGIQVFLSPRIATLSPTNGEAKERPLRGRRDPRGHHRPGCGGAACSRAKHSLLSPPQRLECDLICDYRLVNFLSVLVSVVSEARGVDGGETMTGVLVRSRRAKRRIFNTL